MDSSEYKLLSFKQKKIESFMWGKAKTIEALGINDRLFVIIGIPAISLVFPFLFFDSYGIPSLQVYIAKAVISFFYTVVYWLSVRSVCIYFRLRFPSYKDTPKRLFYYFSAIVVIFSIIQLICMPINRLAETIIKEDIGDGNYIVIPFIMVILISTIYESIFLFYRWKNSVLETEKLKRENVQSQLEGLKNQVNPHFLFNSLNTLAYLIPEDNDKAVCFVQKLSKVYRYILEIREQKLISLDNELEFLQSYIFLVRERFGNNISVSIEIDEALKNHYIVPLSLQILFENAIKHNIISKDKKLRIHVFSDDDTLIVQNNLQKKILTAPSTKVGLKNIKNRYAYFVDQKVEVVETSEHFTVQLPLIVQEIVAV